MSVYLDWNATTSRHPTVRQAMDACEEEAWANPSSVHQRGRAARNAQETTREALARCLGRSPRDVVFTGGGTEANHLALSGARLLVVSPVEHPSVLAQAELLAQSGTRVLRAEVSSDGVVSPESIESALRQFCSPIDGALDFSSGRVEGASTPVVAVMAVNHETGVVQPIEAIAAIAHRYGARLHVDAVQWLGKAPTDALLCADSLSVAAHKLRGPKGVGALVFGCGWTPIPLARGGAQERGLRPGTVDAVALAGFGAALARLPESEYGYGKAARLGRMLAAHLTQYARGALTIHGSAVPRLEHVVNFRVVGWRGDELVAALDLQGICVSSGSACSAGTSEPSAVISAMLGKAAAAGAVRVSLGEDTAPSELQALIRALDKLGILEPAADPWTSEPPKIAEKAV